MFIHSPNKEILGRIAGSSHAKNQLYSFSRFDRTSICDRQTRSSQYFAASSTGGEVIDKRREADH